MGGGLTKGPSHSKGGIKMKVKSTGQQIEVEGGEGIINKHVMSSKKKISYRGKKATPCEIASDLNQQTGNGVRFDCDETKNTDMTPTDQSTGFAKGGKTNAQVPITKVILTDFDKKTYFGQYKRVFKAFESGMEFPEWSDVYEIESSGKRDKDGNYILLISTSPDWEVQEKLNKIRGIT